MADLIVGADGIRARRITPSGFVAHCFAPSVRTDMIGSSKRNSDRKSTNTPTHDGNSELLEIREQEKKDGGKSP